MTNDFDPMRFTSCLVHPWRLASPPLSSKEYVFYLTALRRVGELLHGDDWCDATKHARPFKIVQRANVPEVFPERMPVKLPPEPVRPLGIRGPAYEVVPHSEKIEAWRRRKERWEASRPALVAQAEQEYEAACADEQRNAPVRAKVESAHRCLVQAILDDEVSAFFCAPGDDQVSLRKNFLNAPGASNDLMTRGLLKARGKDCDAFVSAADLDRLCARLASPLEPVVDGLAMENLSPYLRLMIHVATEAKISETKYDTVPTLTAELLREAPKFGLSVGSSANDFLSETMAKTLAKALRWPSARTKGSG